MTKQLITFLLVTVLIVIGTNCKLYSQAPAIEWQNSIGGYRAENFAILIPTADGGFIAGVESRSESSADKSENTIGSANSSDYWVVKMDYLGNIEWENTIGGNSDDNLTGIAICADGGYILSGHSFSMMSGDKSENRIGTGSLAADFWIVRIDINGNILWENTIGGEGSDYNPVIIQTTDGGFLIGGNSDSDAIGDKSENNIGSYDCWIIKINPEGNIEWQNTIGGTLGETLSDIKQTTDGGYLLGADSYSDSSPDKSENNLGTEGNDYWIIKLNNAGEIVWENTIGGTKSDELQSLALTSDGGFVVAGYSNSDISPDKTENTKGAGFDFDDYWIIKFDLSGNMEWQNTIGGKRNDQANFIQQTSDGGYIVGGSSESDAGADKTENNYGDSADEFNQNDYWIVKLNNEGDLEWDKTFGGNLYDVCLSIYETPDAGFIICGSSASDAGFDKSEANIANCDCNYPDVWIIKLMSNGCQDPAGLFVNNITPVKATLHWNNNPYAESFQIWYRETGMATWIKKSATLNFKTIKSLSPETEYEYKIRTKCADGFSEFTPLDYFTTLPLKESELVENLSVPIAIGIYPNPNNGTFEISVNNLAPASPPYGGTRGMSIDVFNSLGQLIYSQQINSSDNNFTETITLDNISSGIYFVRVGDGNNYAEQKFIVEK